MTRAGAIPTARKARSVDDVRRIAHQEFVRWFDATLAGDETAHATIARDVLALWTEQRAD